MSLWSVEYILDQSIANFGRISNSIEISLVERAPGLDNEAVTWLKSRILILVVQIYQRRLWQKSQMESDMWKSSQHLHTGKNKVLYKLCP